MKSAMGKRLTAAAAALAAMTMLLTGCGGSGSAKGGDDGAAKTDAKSQSEPAAGFDGDFKGSFAMPSVSKQYNNPQPVSNVKDGGTLTLGSVYTANWNSFSNDGNTAYMSQIWNYYMPQLIHYDLKGNQTWNKDYLTKVTLVSKKPEVVKYEINPQAKWNNGKDLDWTAFKSTWEINNGKNKEYSPAITDGYQDIQSVEPGKDAKEAVVTFAKPYFPWQSLFSTLYNPEATAPDVYSKGWVDNPHNEWGAGPFKVTTANKDEAVVERNPAWWGAKPKLDKVTFKFMEDSALLNAFKNGETDVTSASNNNDLQMARTRKDVQIRIGYSLSTNVFTLNGKSGPLKDLNVRKAVTMATDYNMLNKVKYQGWDWWKPQAPGSEIVLVFQQGYEDNRPADMKRNVDVAGAGKALEASGYKKGSDGYYAKDGKPLTVKYTYFGDKPTTTAIAKAFGQMMKAAGIKADLDNKDMSKWSKTVGSGDYEVMSMGWQAGNPYGQTSLYQLYGSDSDSNYAFVGSSKIDELAKVPGTIENQNDAIKATNKAEAEAFKLYGTFPYDVPPDVKVVKKGLANYGPAGFATVDPLTVGWQK